VQPDQAGQGGIHISKTELGRLEITGLPEGQEIRMVDRLEQSLG